MIRSGNPFLRKALPLPLSRLEIRAGAGDAILGCAPLKKTKEGVKLD